jgi:hypothetical protein
MRRRPVSKTIKLILSIKCFGQISQIYYVIRKVLTYRNTSSINVRLEQFCGNAYCTEEDKHEINRYETVGYGL